MNHPEYDLSVAEMQEHEQPHLMPMVTPFDGYVEEPGRVSSTCLVSLARNHYSVPSKTVLNLTQTGDLRAAKIGRAYVMLERDVMNYIERQIVEQAADRMEAPARRRR